MYAVVVTGGKQHRVREGDLMAGNVEAVPDRLHLELVHRVDLA